MPLSYIETICEYVCIYLSVQKGRRYVILVGGRFVPITGVGKSWGRSGDFFQWMSILALRYCRTRDCIYLIFAISSILRTKHSLRVAFKVIVWSLRCLWIGKWPSHGPFGEFLDDPKATPLDTTLYRRGTWGLRARTALLYRGQAYIYRERRAVYTQCDSRIVSNPKAGSDLADGYYALCYALAGDQDYKRDQLNLANVNSAKPCAAGVATPCATTHTHTASDMFEHMCCIDPVYTCIELQGSFANPKFV